jgi:hypothetical protein
MTMQMLDAGKKLEVLKKRTRLDLSVNDIRIILGCFRAVGYQEEIDHESYLDQDGLKLNKRLHSVYAALLKENGINGDTP